MDTIIEATHLVKKFGDFTAVDDISFNVKKGELFGFLGPNGAGKSTTIYMLTTLIPVTSGNASVNGFDVASQSDSARASIGIVFQDPTVDTRLSAYDNLDIHGRLAREQDCPRLTGVRALGCETPPALDAIGIVVDRGLDLDVESPAGSKEHEVGQVVRAAGSVSLRLMDPFQVQAIEEAGVLGLQS